MQDAASGRGRLSPERIQEVYDHVLARLVDAGYEGLTMDAIALAASCSKATLYRQWGGKENLVVDALESHRHALDCDQVDTGSLRGDLHEWARMAADAPEKDIEVILAVMHACTVSPELRTAVRDRVLDSEDSELNQLFQRAVGRGEIAADAPAFTYLPALFVGCFLVRQLLEDDISDEDYLTGLVDTVVLPALGIH